MKTPVLIEPLLKQPKTTTNATLSQTPTKTAPCETEIETQFLPPLCLSLAPFQSRPLSLFLYQLKNPHSFSLLLSVSISLLNKQTPECAARNVPSTQSAHHERPAQQ